MLTRTLEGITIEPMSTAADTPDQPWQTALPGQAPFVRGGRGGGFHGAPWLVAQEVPLPGVAELNAALRHDLGQGQTAVNLVLDRAAQEGEDPATAGPGSVGVGGTSVADLTDLEAALQGIDLRSTPILIDGGAGAVPAAAVLVALVKKAAWDPAGITGCVGCDPVFGLARTGMLPVAMDALYDQLADLSDWAAEHAPQLRTLPVHETPWHEAGADSARSLGMTLAAGVHVLRQMEVRGLDLTKVVPQLQFNLCIGGDFFMEIAKLRALRLLWTRVLEAAGLEPCPAFIHARTSRRTLSGLDPHVNLLRVTTGAMSAILGSADSLHTSAFDEPRGTPDEFSRRIARNVQLILVHECHLDQVADPVGGAWYPEKLTFDLAAKAWEHFQQTERVGGIVAALKTGTVQQEAATVAAERISRLATRRDVLIGVNQYAAPQGSPPKVRAFDQAAFAKRRAREVADRKPAEPKARGFEAMVTAASAGATLAQLQTAGADGLAVGAMPLRRDTEPFEILRSRVSAAGDAQARRIFCACLGDSAGYMPRLDFVRRFFQAGGFTIDAERHFAAPGDAAAGAAAAGAGTVVIVGLDATYQEQAAATAKHLQALDPPPRVILAGQPGALEAELTAAGVTEFIHLRSDVLEVLGRLAADLEVQP